MTRYSIVVLMFAGAVVSMAGDFLSIEPPVPGQTFLTLVGGNSLAKTDNYTLTSAVAQNSYIAAYDGGGNWTGGGVCQLRAPAPNQPAMVTLTMSKVSVTIAIGTSSPPTTIKVVNTQGSDTQFTDVQPFGSSNLPSSQTTNAFSPNSLSIATGDASENCKTLAKYQLDIGEIWQITPQAPQPAVTNGYGRGLGGDSGGGGVPIIGYSLTYLAPKYAHFECSGNSATLEGTNDGKKEITYRTLALQKEKPGTTSTQNFLNLDGVKSFNITIYPELAEITKSIWSDTLQFTAPSKYTFVCSPDKRVLTIQQKGKPAETPQQFVVTWSQDWWSPSRTMSVDCGGCNLQLATKETKK